MSSVPEDIYLEILLRVPVKSTFVCKCVCRTWLSIISNPNFIKMHLNLTTQRKDPSLMLRGCNDDSETEVVSALYHIGYDTLLSPATESADDVFIFDDPFNSKLFVNLKGTCNGLLCLGYVTDVDAFTCLWNPATKEIKIIPKSPNEYEDKHCEIFAFVYDPKTDDYKLIIVVVFDEDPDKNLVDVYSLVSDSWKSSKPPLPYAFPFRREIGEIVNGALHWLCKTPDTYDALVISLDVSDEKFTEVKLPKELLKEKYMPMTVGVLEGCLCILAKDVKAGFEFWLMHDYGVHKSWSKRYTINHERIVSTHYLRLMRSFENGLILLCYCGHLVIYDMKNSCVREPNNFSSLSFYDADTYVESLVSLNSGIYLGRNKNEEREEEASSNDIVISGLQPFSEE